MDAAQTSGDFRSLMEITHCADFKKLFDNTNKTEQKCLDAAGANNPNLTSPELEVYLLIQHAKLIADLHKEIHDYPLNPCCSCKRLYQRKSVTTVTLGDDFRSDVVFT